MVQAIWKDKYSEQGVSGCSLSGISVFLIFLGFFFFAESVVFVNSYLRDFGMTIMLCNHNTLEKNNPSRVQIYKLTSSN